MEILQLTDRTLDFVFHFGYSYSHTLTLLEASPAQFRVRWLVPPSGKAARFIQRSALEYADR